MTFRILACDGGGIRGYMSSHWVQAINTETGGALVNGADAYAGNSTGGLIATGLGGGLSMDTIVSIYSKTLARQVFHRHNTLFSDVVDFGEEIADKIAGFFGKEHHHRLDLPGVFGSKFTAEGFRDVIMPLVEGQTFGNAKSGKQLSINTIQLWDESLGDAARWMPRTLNNRHIEGDYSDFSLGDACCCTAAAPTLFPPHLVDGWGYFADGGLFSNDPVLNAIEVARGHNPDLTLNDFQVISFGTGLSPEGIKPADIKDPTDWGLLKWMGIGAPKGVPYFAMMKMGIELTSSNTNAISKVFMGDQMMRFNPVLPEPVSNDDTSDANYALMDGIIEDVLKSDDFKRACEFVSNW